MWGPAVCCCVTSCEVPAPWYAARSATRRRFARPASFAAMKAKRVQRHVSPISFRSYAPGGCGAEV